MPAPRVFVSSTAYDLSAVRESLRSMIRSIGFDAVLSDYSDILYDPRHHTHTSCVKDVESADLLVLIIGPRFGGEGVPEALAEMDLSMLEQFSSGANPLLDGSHSHSITQLEVLLAITGGVPVFTFVDANVWSEHHLYQANKSKDFSSSIEYPSIEKQETATYIFDFINFLRLRSTNNALLPFRSVSEIEAHLKRQWAMYFQRLLSEERARDTEAKRIDKLSEQLDDLKSAILSSIPEGDAREVATGVVNFRGLVGMLKALPNFSIADVENYPADFFNMLHAVGVEDLVSPEPDQRTLSWTLFRFKDGSGFLLRGPIRQLKRIAEDWTSFRGVQAASKKIIFESLNNDRVRYSSPIRPQDKTQVDELVAMWKESGPILVLPVEHATAGNWSAMTTIVTATLDEVDDEVSS